MIELLLMLGSVALVIGFLGLVELLFLAVEWAIYRKEKKRKKREFKITIHN